MAKTHLQTEKTRASVAERQAFLGKKYPQWKELTLAQHFATQCQSYKDRPLLMMPEETYSYAEIWRRSEELAKALLALGVKQKDHVAVLMANDPDFIALWIAVSMVGAVTVPLNTQLREEELNYMIDQSDTQWLFFHQCAGKQNHGAAIQRIEQKLKQKKANQLKQVICIPNKKKPIPKHFKSWSDFILNGKKCTDQNLKDRWKTAANPHETAAIIYTSGSTGLPKGVMLTDDMMLRSGFATCLSRAYEDGRRIFAPLPLYHVYFLEEGLFAVSFVGGAMISSTGFAPLQALELMERYKADDFLAVPSMLVSILNQKKLKNFNLEALNALLCCAAPSPVPLWKRAVEELGVQEIGTGCGGTEASSTTMLTEIGDALEVISTRVGKIKNAGIAGKNGFSGKSVEYKVINPDTGKDLPNGSVGELAVRGNVVTRGYYNKPDETAFALSHEGWLRSGDLGKIDKKGYIQLLGRSKNLYKVSGETVAPKEIEDVVSIHPNVAQMHVVGVPDRFTTEAGAAFIELKSGKTVSAQEIRTWCKNRIARFKVPRHVWFMKEEDWPLTATGKIQKFKLQELAEARLKTN